MTVDRFSLTKHSLSQRTESALKISSLFFPPSFSVSVQIEMNSAEETEWVPHTPSGAGGGGGGVCIESLQDIHQPSESLFILQASGCGVLGRRAYQMETTALCQFRFDPGTMRKPAMEMSSDNMPLKINFLSSFILEFSAQKLRGLRCIKSLCATGNSSKSLWNERS